MSAIQFKSRHAASLICHLGGGCPISPLKGGHRAFGSQLWIHGLKRDPPPGRTIDVSLRFEFLDLEETVRHITAAAGRAACSLCICD